MGGGSERDKFAYLSIFSVVWRISNLIFEQFLSPNDKEVISPNVKKKDLSAGASASRVAFKNLQSIIIKTILIISTQTLYKVFAVF